MPRYEEGLNRNEYYAMGILAVVVCLAMGSLFMRSKDLQDTATHGRGEGVVTLVEFHQSSEPRLPNAYSWYVDVALPGKVVVAKYRDPLPKWLRFGVRAMAFFTQDASGEAYDVMLVPVVDDRRAKPALPRDMGPGTRP